MNRQDKPESDDAADPPGSVLSDRPDYELVTEPLLRLGDEAGQALTLDSRRAPGGLDDRILRELDELSGASLLDSARRYKLGPIIGGGGVADVHLGWDTRLNREIAVKVLQKDLADQPTLVQRFLQEARVTGRLQHPGILAIHEIGILPDRRPFFTMNLVRGETLQQILARRSDPHEDCGRFLSIFEKICDAVAHAHSMGVIHRDLKPANVMVGGFGLVLVIDWGLAKVISEPEDRDDPDPPFCPPSQDDEPDVADPSLWETQVGSIFGTPAYLAPEQAHGSIDQIDRRVDVFGLGSILCTILTGSPPYVGRDTKHTLTKAVAADLGEAIVRLDGCRGSRFLIDLAKACLAPRPADRPSSAVEVAGAITLYLQSERRRAERDLVQFFNLSLDLFCIASPRGYFDRVNQNFTRVLGYTAEELTSKPFLDFVHPEDRDNTREVLKSLNQGELCIRFLNRYRHARGHYHWFEWNARLSPEDQMIYAAARDVTDRIEPGVAVEESS